ncbi:MAG: TlyA family RNA methyltransferase [Aquificota bacterium]|uniref:TlyA family RNA methyltransferase n=1 Tax=Thermosulfidibacter takaii TaxID=412593 RepID=A0A7C0U6Z3_9BACT|nr:MAG: TlyA family RNA methyltransferase [Aquificota bacterium]HDD53290.1 TlyA family RNA methyltransferase [Thermosulfidibacter takaii]
MAGAKRRLDVLLVERGLVESREKAQALVMAGQVWVQGQRVDKAGKAFPPDVEIEVKGEACPYVSRGGLKLEGALDSLDIDVADKVVADFGASTGGFTHCLLARGAKKVYALDVGYGQLHWILRQDPRVVVMEKVNVRYLEAFHLGEEVDMVVADLSFISLTLVLPAVKRALRGGGEALLLVKPQFEVGREKVGKGGVVRDDAARREALERVKAKALELGFQILGEVESPVPGAKKGNIEIFLYLRLSQKAG